MGRMDVFEGKKIMSYFLRNTTLFLFISVSFRKYIVNTGVFVMKILLLCRHRQDFLFSLTANLPEY
jgi:hypothetical protein